MTSSLSIGGQAINLSLPIKAGNNGQPENDSTSSNQSTASSTTSPAVPQVAAGNIKWFQLQKNFGPVHIQKVGLKYSGGDLYFELDASLTAAGLSLSLIDLGVGSSLSSFSPVFSLDGLGIDFQKDNMPIEGIFLREQVKQNGRTLTEYNGMALIKTETFSLSAMGSYADYEGHPSLFLYAVLDEPLGGPPFFFVEGLAAGFGYNRNLVMPTIDQVQNFPLVVEAMNGASPPANAQDVTTALARLNSWIPPQAGEEFLAIGVKFSSFKMIDSFAVLTVKFGQSLEVNVLGLSN